MKMLSSMSHKADVSYSLLSKTKSRKNPNY